MTLFDNYAFEIVDDENGALEIAAEAPKLPFDANDYLNFELNEAFIVPSADFMNNYRVSSASLSSMSSITNIQELSLDITEDDAVATAASEIPNCLWEDQTINTYDDSLNEFIDYDITLSMPTGSNNTPSGARSPLGDTTVSMNHSRQEAEATFNYKTTFPNYAYTHPFTTDTHHKHTSYSNIPSPSNLVKGNSQSNISNAPPVISYTTTNTNNNTKITDYDHPDFRCGVITRNGHPCKNKITCTFHTYDAKSRVERSDTVDNLLQNWKWIQQLSHPHTIILGASSLSSGFGEGGDGGGVLKRGFEVEETAKEGGHVESGPAMKRHNSCSGAIDKLYWRSESVAVDDLDDAEEDDADATQDELELEDYDECFSGPEESLLLWKKTVALGEELTYKLLIVEKDEDVRVREFHERVEIGTEKLILEDLLETHDF